jgi:type II secretory pathway component GspD/PulD (secretin)
MVEVSVMTGRVAVYEKGDLVSKSRLTSGVIITPNERVTYYTENHHFITSLVDTPVAVNAVAGAAIPVKFVFEDAPLSEVLDNLQKAYNIQISVENDNLNHCPFTGDISGQSLYDKLEMICQSIGSTYEIKGTAILIKGKGCD